MPANRPLPDGLLARAIVLVALLALANLWLARHAGVGIQNSGLIATLVAAFGAAVSFVQKLLDEREAGHITDRVRTVLRVMLSAPVLVFLSLFVAVGMLTFSSITVLGELPEEEGRVRVAPLDDDAGDRTASLGPDLRPARFHLVPTTPFGRRYRVEAAGYVPAVFDVYPLTGLEIRLGTQLQPAPSVLFRPAPEVFRSLLNGGRIRIDRVAPGARVTLADTTGTTAFLLGREQTPATALQQDWPLELADQDEVTRGETLLRWKRPMTIVPRVPLQPGAILHAQVFTRAGVLIAENRFSLRPEALIDARLDRIGT